MSIHKLLSIIFITLTTLVSFNIKASTVGTVGADASNKRPLVVYTSSSFSSHWGAGEQLKKLFEEKYNCELKFITFDHVPSIISRLKLEKEHSNADIVLGLDAHHTDLEEISNFFVPYKDKLRPLDLPIPWNSGIFVPYCYGYLSFIYNSDNPKFASSLPKNFSELLSDQNDFKIILPDPRISNLGYDMLLWTYEVFGKEFGAKWFALNKKIKLYTKGWSEAWSLFINGESDLVLSYDTSAGYHKVKGEDKHFKALFLEDGHLIQVQVLGKPKNRRENPLADDFIKFILTEEAQAIIMKHNYSHAVINLPDDIKPELKPVNAQAVALAVERKNVLDLWINAVTVN